MVKTMGFGRNAIYRMAAEGRIKLKKHGKVSLVCMDSVRAVLAEMPEAVIRPAA